MWLKYTERFWDVIRWLCYSKICIQKPVRTFLACNLACHLQYTEDDAVVFGNEEHH